MRNKVAVLWLPWWSWSLWVESASWWWMLLTQFLLPPRRLLLLRLNARNLDGSFYDPRSTQRRTLNRAGPDTLACEVQVTEWLWIVADTFLPRTTSTRGRKFLPHQHTSLRRCSIKAVRIIVTSGGERRGVGDDNHSTPFQCRRSVEGVKTARWEVENSKCSQCRSSRRRIKGRRMETVKWL